MWLADYKDSSNLDLPGKARVILSSALLWWPSRALPQPSSQSPHQKEVSVPLPEHTCWRRCGRREAEGSQRYGILPLSEAPLGSLSLSSRGGKSHFPHPLELLSPYFICTFFLQFHIHPPRVQHNPRFWNVSIVCPCSHYLCLVSTE